MMRLLRVQVPEFRALKNVDISFEPEFTPQVFPLGSLNGGGKSTLLQLIFVLLHCSAHEERHPFIANMLDGITIPEGETSKVLAQFRLLTFGEIELEFIVCNDGYLQQLDIDPIFNKERISFNNLSEETKLSAQYKLSEEYIKELKIDGIKDDDGIPIDPKYFIYHETTELEQIGKALQNLKPLVKNIIESFELKQQIYITKSPTESIGLVCRFLNIERDIRKTKDIIKIPAASGGVFF